MISFELLRTEFRLHFSFLLFNAVIFLYDSSGLIICFYTACLLHELGHIAAAHMTRQSIVTVELKGSGILMIPEKNAAAPLYSGIIVLMSGPAVNLLLWTISYLNGWNYFAAINLMLFLYNMLPYKQLDGGAALSLILCGWIYERAADILLTLIKAAIPVVLLLLVLSGKTEFIPVSAAAVLLFISDS
ncbi:MAG: hypothetical protein K6G20_05320 [Ruminococcus sp.]|nr:hypothetical protein [Ruminococcus sp.]